MPGDPPNPLRGEVVHRGSCVCVCGGGGCLVIQKMWVCVCPRENLLLESPVLVSGVCPLEGEALLQDASPTRALPGTRLSPPDGSERAGPRFPARGSAVSITLGESHGSSCTHWPHSGPSRFRRPGTLSARRIYSITLSWNKREQRSDAEPGGGGMSRPRGVALCACAGFPWRRRRESEMPPGWPLSPVPLLSVAAGPPLASFVVCNSGWVYDLSFTLAVQH